MVEKLNMLALSRFFRALSLLMMVMASAIFARPSPTPMNQPGPSEPRSPEEFHLVPFPSEVNLPGPSVPILPHLPPLPEVPVQTELVPYAKTDSDQALHDFDMLRSFHHLAQFLPVRPVFLDRDIAVSPVWSLNGMYFNRPGPHLAIAKQQLDLQWNAPRHIILGNTRNSHGMVFAAPMVKTDMMDAYVHNLKDDEFLWTIITAFPLHTNKPWLYDSFIVMQNVQSALVWNTLNLHHATVNINQILARLGG